LNLSLSAQITFTHAPKEGAFLARDLKTNVAKYVIEGVVTDPSYTSISVEVFRNNSLERSYQMSLRFTQGKAFFKRPIALTAGRHTYSIKYTLNGGSAYSSQVNNLMAGDVYLIQGQSNSVASNFSGGFQANAFQDPFVRSFGSSSNNGTSSNADSFWHDANGDLTYRSGSIGQWGMVMAKTLLDSFNVPICILNGGVGGTRIGQHQRDRNNPENLSTIYGRLLSRVRKADLLTKVRGIFYYQGESDGAFAVHHDTLFKKLHGYWKEDFPNFEKLFVVQVREGCGSPSMQLREVQRQFEFNLPNCQTISSNGLNGHDGCHFKFSQGYKELGFQIAALAARDFYNSPHTKNIDPPNIKDCYYSNATKTEITLNLMHPDDDIRVDAGFYALFRLEGDPSVQITGGTIVNNRIVLKLNKSSCLVSGLSYDGKRRIQPWVKNKIGTALISFYNQPIKYQYVKSEYTGCKNSKIELGEDSIAGNHYLWTRLLTNKTYTTPKISVIGQQRELFYLVISYPKSNCKVNDTLRIFSIPEDIQLPNLGPDTTLCFGDTLKLNVDSSQFQSSSWRQHSSSLKGFSFNVSKEGPIIVTVTSKAACLYKDTLNIEFNQPMIQLPNGFSLCQGKDTLLSTTREYNNYVWNGVIGGRTYRTSAALVTLSVTDSFGCPAYDSINISEHSKLKVPKLDIAICDNSSASIQKPAGFEYWYSGTDTIPNILNVYSNKTYPISLSDSFGCVYLDTIAVGEYSLPTYSLGPDTGFCKDATLQLSLPMNMKEYFVNGVSQSNENFLISQAGNYFTSIIDSNNCKSSDTIKIDEYSLPTLESFSDTLVCANKTVSFVMDLGIKYYVNTVLINQTYTFDDSGSYSIKAINGNECEMNKEIHVSYKTCVNSVYQSKADQISIFPNPSSGILNVVSNTPLQEPIYLYNKSGKLVYQSTFDGKRHSLNTSNYSKGMYYLRLNGIFNKVLVY